MMISEIDIRDWDKSITAARECLDSLDDYARMRVGVDAVGNRTYLEEFINKVEALVYVKQPQVAALFKEKK